MFHLRLFCPNDVEIRQRKANLSSRAEDKKKAISWENLSHSNEADKEQR